MPRKSYGENRIYTYLSRPARNIWSYSHRYVWTECKGYYCATSNNMKLVHWPLVGGLLYLVQRGRDGRALARPGHFPLYPGMGSTTACSRPRPRPVSSRPRPRPLLMIVEKIKKMTFLIKIQLLNWQQNVYQSTSCPQNWGSVFTTLHKSTTNWAHQLQTGDWRPMHPGQSQGQTT